MKKTKAAISAGAAALVLMTWATGAHAKDDKPTETIAVSAHLDRAWSSYRAAYKGMLDFESYPRAKDLIEVRYRLLPAKPGIKFNGLRVTLVGENTNLAIPVSGLGTLSLPMQRQAYEEDAQLIANREKGSLAFTTLVYIKSREDGVYPIRLLKAACSQAREYWLSTLGFVKRLAWQNKRCAGISFWHPEDPFRAPSVAWVDAAGEHDLPHAQLSATYPNFDDDVAENTAQPRRRAVTILQFATTPDDALVKTEPGTLLTADLQ